MDFYNYDLYSQCLAKLLRSSAVDLDDVAWYIQSGRVKKEVLSDLFERVWPELVRYPAIDPESFTRRVKEFVQ